jgi:quercetin dioxygenase-like cupin family protein
MGMIVSDIREQPPEQWRPGVETRMLVSASNGATQLCIFEQWIAPGTGAPTHSHPVEEILTVREGEAEMWLDQERIIVSVGQSLIVPPGRMHGFRNSGTATALSPRGAGLAGFRGHHGGRDGNGAKVASGVRAKLRRHLAPNG